MFLGLDPNFFFWTHLIFTPSTALTIFKNYSLARGYMMYF